jgi:hypothetical protein
MKLLVFLLILVSQAFATNEEAWPLECENDLPAGIAPLTNILNSKFFSSSSKYYLYYEAKTLEDLQVLKNCLDYTACGKTKESITEDPKNNRVHIWANLTKKELTSLVRSCPIKDINKKLEVKEVDHQGKIVSLSGLTPSFFEQSQFIRSASPALFDEPSDKIIYGGVADHVAVTTHKDKMINYGKDWLAEPCSYIRMVRHEAEHVAQFKRAKMCNLEHNYADHQMRERAAHLNDLRFLKTYCPGSAAIKYDCLERFRTKYMNLRKPPSK